MAASGARKEEKEEGSRRELERRRRGNLNAALEGGGEALGLVLFELLLHLR